MQKVTETFTNGHALVLSEGRSHSEEVSPSEKNIGF